MTGENSTLEDLAEELKAAQEKVEESAAFPTDLLNEKNKEMLENDPVDFKTTNGKKAVSEDNDNKKRKLVNVNNFEDETVKEKEDENLKKQKLVELKCGDLY